MKDEHKAVVQIFVESGYFDWSQPYKTPEYVSAFGSGFFIDEKGHLITSYHVVAQATGIAIQIPTLGKEQFDVEIVGVCPDKDIALLKLTDQSYQKVVQLFGKIYFLKIGDSDPVVRQEEIVALGYPLGQDVLKSTQGIISGRQSLAGESFVQITAALNPGNSGGPTLDKNGEVIGINTAVIPEAQNIGYIIAISDVKCIIEDLFKIRLLRRPLLGCELNYATNDMLSYLKNPSPGGLYITRVYKNTLFEQAGIKAGDMLYQINGFILDMYGDVSVEWSEDKLFFTSLLDRFRIGETIDTVVYRNGERVVAKIPFKLQDELPIRVVYPDFEPLDMEMFGGMSVMEMTINHVMTFLEVNPFLIQYRKREFQDEPRLIVTTIFPNSQALKTRTLFPGDILDEINGIKVRTLQDFRKALQGKKDYVTVKTENRKFIVLSVEKVNEDMRKAGLEFEANDDDTEKGKLAV